MSLRDRQPAAPAAAANGTVMTAGQPVRGGSGLTQAARIALGLTRIAVGWTFLWAFADKLFGLGFATPAERSWLNGGSPTKGFLANSAEGPFAGFYKDIAGSPMADWLFMLGLLGIGVAFLFGIGMRIGAIAAAVLYVLMWTVVLPPANNPVIDDHILGALIVTVLGLTAAGNYLGLGNAWRRTKLVRRLPWLT
jgi:thiosulfate dehydrogenase [quinone] large subunit